MTLPLEPPLLPQLARSAPELPDGDGWVFERKWDGFRAIAFVDGDELHLQSRNGRPLVRYFPELRFPPGRYVLDGELVIRDSAGGEEFDALQERIHPAASRVAMLAERTPARFVAFDLLARDDRSLLDLPFAERRTALEEMIAEPLELAAATTDRAAAAEWLRDAEGVIAKRVDAAYLPGKREGMLKIKRVRTIDCVAVGWRPGKAKGTVGSIILGLYDDGEEPAVVGHTSGFTAARARELVDDPGALRVGGAGHRRAQPVERRPRSGVARAAPGAGGRGQLRPPKRPPHPPRRQAASPARGPRSALLPDRPAGQLTAAFPG